MIIIIYYRTKHEKNSYSKSYAYYNATGPMKYFRFLIRLRVRNTQEEEEEAEEEEEDEDEYCNIINSC